MFPEIIFFAEADNSVVRDTDFIFPYLFSLVIAFINGNPEAVGRDFESFCEKFPSPFDSFIFEVVTEGEISEHLEISTVTGSFSDTFNIGSADTFLTGSNSHIRGDSLTEEIFFKGSHS